MIFAKKFFGAGLLCLATVSAEAATVDKFKCTMQLIGHDRDDRLKTVVETAGIRQDYSTDDWVEGVNGTKAEILIDLADFEGESVGYMLNVRYIHAFNTDNSPRRLAAQSTCVREQGWQGTSAWSQNCAMLQPIPPFNPLDYWTHVDMEFSGPEFRSQDLIPISHNFNMHSRWRRAEGNCQFLGTEN